MNNYPNGKRSKVFAFGTGQWARHKSTGANVIIVGARRVGTKHSKKTRVLLVVARVTGTKKNHRYIVAKASSFAARKGGPAPTRLVLAA